MTAQNPQTTIATDSQKQVKVLKPSEKAAIFVSRLQKFVLGAAVTGVVFSVGAAVIDTVNPNTEADSAARNVGYAAIAAAVLGNFALSDARTRLTALRKEEKQEDRISALQTQVVTLATQAEETSVKLGELKRYQEADPVHHLNQVVLPLTIKTEKAFDAFQDLLEQRNFQVEVLQDKIALRNAAFAEASSTPILSMTAFLQADEQILELQEVQEAEAEA